MAKAKSKETSVPLIFALVFFILTTIAFGVMWYLSLAEVEQAKADKKKAEDPIKQLRDDARAAEQKARVYRIWIGIDDGDDLTTIEAEKGQGATISNELIKLNEAVAKRLSKPDAASLDKEYQYWRTGPGGKVGVPGAELDTVPPYKPTSLLDQISRLNKMDVAYQEATKDRTVYTEKTKDMQVAITGLTEEKKKYQQSIKEIKDKNEADLKRVFADADARKVKYESDTAALNKRVSELTEERDNSTNQVRKLKETIATLQADNQQLLVRTQEAKKETFTFDEPQGKILRKLPEGVVEINLGSAAGVRPGLTFTVLPPDFPEKGRQSRVRMLRVPDGRGKFKSVESFVPKGSIEVYDVVGPNLSLARIQAGSELDPIRDGITVGDLIYNSVWRKGVADHIALVGIFDINGDGTDDIESVVKDLIKMGIPVDAYFDMKKRQWVGQVTERTRYIVQGYLPINGVNDPNREEKTKLLDAITKAINEGKQKGVTTIDFRDFFSRMGYKFRLDVSDDKVNQATAPYLSNVGVGNSPIPPPPGP